MAELNKLKLAKDAATIRLFLNAFTIITPFVVIKRLSRKLRIILNIHTNVDIYFHSSVRYQKKKVFLLAEC
ncbi:hypothetical protein CHBNV3_18010 [Haemophilus influenzae]|nr:hypothetical protein CHBNIII5_16500 [Haemophilus influenzae]BBF06059.1 hypothetical protein CHBNIII6_17440 [Haemophilus influenzae]BBF14937.1 hypothetical protein CHBNV2_16400 [Haemophilus influenzae]BBF16798.1 hypothetical protein CHBNV3_18010 [Haemophilus influenzae]GBK74219.1 hypothetical protein NTHiID1_16100 [Haemophilus influenzae]